MIRKVLILLSLYYCTSVFSQGVTQCGTPTGMVSFPLDSYQELPDPKPIDVKSWNKVKGTQASWGTKDIRYGKHEVPSVLCSKGLLKGWKGEKVHTQAIIWTYIPVKHLNLELTSFSNGKESLPTSSISASFERYVLTDQLNLDGKGACGNRSDHTIYDSLLVADCIDPLLKETNLPEKTAQPVWVSCKIPSNASGTYKGSLLVKDGNKVLKKLPLSIQVINRTLKDPSQWTFHLDLWQNPYAVSRYYQVQEWSPAHLAAMHPIMKRLADAGQKVITASITHKPWNGQTEDAFESMLPG